MGQASRVLRFGATIAGAIAAISVLVMVIAEASNGGISGLRGLECAPVWPAPSESSCRVEDGYWYKSFDGPVEIRVLSGDAVSVFIDGSEVVRRKVNAKARSTSVELAIVPGPHRVRVEKTRADQWVELVAVPKGEDAQPFGPLFRESPSPDTTRFAALAKTARRIAQWAVPLFIASAIIVGLLEPARLALPLLAILLWGGLLRFEAIVASRWPEAKEAARALASIGGTMRPQSWNYTLESYSGDPVTYLRRAREMTSFYDASDREPFFVGLVKVFLGFFGGLDVGLSFASAFSSLLLVALGFVLARRLVGPVGGLATALCLGIHADLIRLSAQGWRDETFAAGVLASLVALLRLMESPTPLRAALFGVASAWPVLTRLSGLSFVLPAFIAFLLVKGWSRWDTHRLSMIAAGPLTVLVAPYLLACWAAFGDPLRAINVHTLYYRAAENGKSVSEAESVGGYLFTERDWIERMDTGAKGLMEIAFARSHDGLESWLGARATGAGLALSALGLALMTLSRPEALVTLVLILFASVPYAWTWPLGSGADFRFTLHVLPLSLIAAISAVRASAHLFKQTATRRAVARSLVLGVSILALAAVGRVALHSLRLWNDGRSGRPVLITGGILDTRVVRGFGWPRPLGGQYVRTATQDPRIVISLQPDTPWVLTVRWWSDRPVTVTEGGQLLGVLKAVDPEDLGFLEIPIPASATASHTFRFQGKLDLWWARLTPGKAEGAVPPSVP
jgi:hypothetical protein